jgi:hypothetical protein
MAAQIAEVLRSGLDPSDVAGQVLTAVREDQLYVFTHPEMRGELEARFAAILSAIKPIARARGSLSYAAARALWRFTKRVTSR